MFVLPDIYEDLCEMHWMLFDHKCNQSTPQIAEWTEFYKNFVRFQHHTCVSSFLSVLWLWNDREFWRVTTHILNIARFAFSLFCVYLCFIYVFFCIFDYAIVLCLLLMLLLFLLAPVVVVSLIFLLNIKFFWFVYININSQH